MIVSGTLPYMDAAGRSWRIEKLDRLLDDPAVLRAVHETRRASLGEDGRLEPGTAYVSARRRYRREECGALLHILMVRLQDREDDDGSV